MLENALYDNQENLKIYGFFGTKSNREGN